MSLSSLGSELATLVAAASPSVVRVTGRPRLGSTGFVWGPDLVLTANHTVHQDNVRVDDHDATVIGRDPTTDLALLRVDGATLTPLEWADAPAVGNFVVALGRPGRSLRASFGIVGVHGESWKSPAGARVDAWLEPMLYLPPGFSGGPLIDTDGHVVGLNTAGLVRGETLALPAATVRRVVADLLADGRPRRGWLGVGTAAARLPDGSRGLVVVSLAQDGPAAQAGVIVGDILVSVDGTPVHHAEELLDRLSGETVGTTLQLGLLRGGAANTVPVVIARRAA